MHRLVIILILFNLSLISSAQSCIPDYIVFNTQGQVDSFQINYPGCTEIEGTVFIRGDDITNLDGLLVLTSIGGSLNIEDASSLKNLQGMDNVSFIGGELIIDENDSLINLSGLNGLVHINETLSIEQNPVLESLTGLENLTTIGEDLNIGSTSYFGTGNPLLNNLFGLQSLSSIGDYLKIGNNHELTDLTGIENLNTVENINISSNHKLKNLTGLEGISNLNGYLEISWNDSLNSLSGLNNLTSAGFFRLFQLPSLYDLSGLERLSIIEYDFEISSINSLNYISSLDSLSEIGGKLTIYSNDELINLSGLENLTEIGGGLLIKNNYSLDNINALSSVTSIGGDLIIFHNSDLTTLAGLSGVTSIDGNLVISNFSALSSLSGIENIDPSTIENLEISLLYSLTDCAFPNICEYLTDPNGVVDIYYNGYPCNSPVNIANACGISLPCLPHGNYHFNYQSQIDSFQTDYPGCTDLEGSLYLLGGWGSGTGDFRDLDGLSVVTSIDGELVISGAYCLASLKGIDNIVATSISDLWISYSSYLSECEVQSICDYLANPSGEVYISDNAYGCNSPDEVLYACETVSVQEQNIESFFNIYPNPANQYLFIDNPSNHKIDKILIFNTIGQVIISQEYRDSSIDISELDEGIYVLEIITDGIVSRMKFLVRN